MISTEIPNSQSFENISMYLTGLPPVLGTVSLRKMAMAYSLYIKEDGISSPDPFTDPFMITPLTKPYICLNGHHIFDLSFYSEITIIEEPARLCFHDPTQELGISLNFKSRNAFNDFFDYLNQQITIISPGLQGFFQINRFQSPMCDQKKLNKKKKNLVDERKSEKNENQDSLFRTHSRLIAKITPLKKQSISAISDLEAAFESQEKMRKLLTGFCVPDERKADVWVFLTGIGPLEKVNEDRKNEYLKLRNQWKTITKSQWCRSNILKKSFNLLKESILQNKQKLMTVVDDPSITSIVFNVIMSVCQVYNFLHHRHNELICLIRVFLWMFVQRSEKNEHGTVYYGYRDELEYENDELETLLFWSMLFILERGEVRRLLEVPEKDKSSIAQQIKDFIYIVHPLIFELLLKKGVKNFDRLTPLLTMHFSTLLTFCDCTDIWIAAMSSENFLEFIQYMIVSCLFFNFPNILSLPATKDQDLMKIIEPMFTMLDHYYLEAATFELMRKSSELLNESLTDIEIS